MFFNKKLLTKSREKLAAIRNDLAIPFEDAINFTPQATAGNCFECA